MQIIIDRIEGDYIVAELPNKSTVNLPIVLIPGAKEGEVYFISKDENEATARSKNIQEKFNKLRIE